MEERLGSFDSRAVIRLHLQWDGPVDAAEAICQLYGVEITRALT